MTDLKDFGFTDAFIAIVELLEVVEGAAPINQHPDCFEYQIDDVWWVASNGHRESRICSRGIAVQPFSHMVMHKWLPVLFLSAHDSRPCAESTERAFIAACAAAKAKLRAAAAAKQENEAWEKCDNCDGRGYYYGEDGTAYMCHHESVEEDEA